MPPDPVGRRERSRARPPLLWGPVRCSRPSGAALLRCPQTPSAKLGASRRRPPPALGVGVLARRAPGSTHARLPPRGARRLSAQAHPHWGGYSCAGWGPGLRLWLLTQLAALLLVVAAVEDVPLAAAGDHALRHAGAGKLVEAAVEGEALGEPALRLGEEEPLVADAPELLTRDGLQEGVGQEREARLGERHSANPRCCAMRCFTSCSTRRRSRSSRRTPGAPLRTRRSASALASRSISASSSKLRPRIAAKRVRIVSSGAVGSSSWACTSRLTRLSATRSICAGDGPMAKT